MVNVKKLYLNCYLGQMFASDVSDFLIRCQSRPDNFSKGKEVHYSTSKPSFLQLFFWEKSNFIEKKIFLRYKNVLSKGRFGGWTEPTK